MASLASEKLWTVAEVADRLQMTNDGVYKLIQRGKLEAVRLSERKTRVTAASLERYTTAVQAWVDRYLDSTAESSADVERQRARFTAETGLGPEAWIAGWKRGELADSAENMRILAQAAALYVTAGGPETLSHAGASAAAHPG